MQKRPKFTPAPAFHPSIDTINGESVRLGRDAGRSSVFDRRQRRRRRGVGIQRRRVLEPQRHRFRAAKTTIGSRVGAASLNAVYDPVLDVTNMISAARKLGYTYSDSWDVLYYTE